MNRLMLIAYLFGLFSGIVLCFLGTVALAWIDFKLSRSEPEPDPLIDNIRLIQSLRNQKVERR